MSGVEVSVLRPREGVAVVCVAGELDYTSGARVERELEDLEGAGPSVVLLDLRSLTFLDSSGLRLILRASERASARGARFALVRGPEAVARVFRLTGTDDKLDFVEDVTGFLGK